MLYGRTSGLKWVCANIFAYKRFSPPPWNQFSGDFITIFNTNQQKKNLHTISKMGLFDYFGSGSRKSLVDEKNGAQETRTPFNDWPNDAGVSQDFNSRLRNSR